MSEHVGVYYAMSMSSLLHCVAGLAAFARLRHEFPLRGRSLPLVVISSVRSLFGFSISFCNIARTIITKDSQFQVQNGSQRARAILCKT